MEDPVSEQREEQKLPFDIDEVIPRVRIAVAAFCKAAMFELADDGFDTVFQQATACIISTRTRDEVTVEAARRLFQAASFPSEMLTLTAEDIDSLITPCTFHRTKAIQILQIARIAATGELPCDRQSLLALPGVGIKCANLVLGVACRVPSISVDIHVHRVTTGGAT